MSGLTSRLVTSRPKVGAGPAGAAPGRNPAGGGPARARAGLPRAASGGRPGRVV